MKRRLHFSKNNLLLGATVLLLLPALLIHLGLVAFYDDEGIRALVALEMKLSGNYVTPTLFGEFFYNKPPLYNWILLAVFEATGVANEFTARLPTVFFLLAYALTVRYFLQQNVLQSDSAPRLKSWAGVVPLALVTCGRILFWDSMLGLIDVCFSLVIYTMLMVIFREGERERYGRLFLFAYFLAAMGYLLKGLPAVVFLGIALPLYFFWQKKGRQLFSVAHLGGLAAFALPVGGYYFFYAQRNGLEQVFRTLFNESAKRTFVEHGLGDTALHLFTFPFEMWAHFLPWTLLAIYFFRKNARSLVFENKFIAWNLLAGVATILPYWASVEVYPRYLLMHVPLFFTVFFYLHEKNRRENSRMFRLVERVFFALCLLAIPASLVPLFLPEMQDVPFFFLKISVLCAAMTGLAELYRRWKGQRLLVLVLVLLVARVGYNWFVLPSRLKIECSTKVRETVLAAAPKVKGQTLYSLEYSLGLQPVTAFYFTRETGQPILAKFKNFDRNALYLINPRAYPAADFEEVARFTTKWECRELVVGRVRRFPGE